jgi:hypothetical protein
MSHAFVSGLFSRPLFFLKWWPDRRTMFADPGRASQRHMMFWVISANSPCGIRCFAPNACVLGEIPDRVQEIQSWPLFGFGVEVHEEIGYLAINGDIKCTVKLNIRLRTRKRCIPLKAIWSYCPQENICFLHM